MTVPRRAQWTLGALGMVLLFGILGLAWWWWRHRPGRQPATRFRRLRATAVAAGLVIIAVGTVWRSAVAIESVPACAPPGSTHGVTRSASGASLYAQIAATWPETGIGLLYSQADGAHVCLSRLADYYVSVHANSIAGARVMTLGDIVITPKISLSTKQRAAIVAHEARHRTQWAVLTAIGGPFAFPVAYAVVDFFFPGSRNFFERQAGLESGGYSHSGTGPVLGPAQLATLGALAVVIAVALLGVWRRHALRRSRSRADPPGAA